MTFSDAMHYVIAAHINRGATGSTGSQIREDLERLGCDTSSLDQATINRKFVVQAVARFL